MKTATPPVGGLYGSQALLAMLGIALGVLLASLDQTIVGTALPRVVAELHGFELYAWVATAYLLSSTVMVPIVGKLGDLYGRKPFLMGAIVVFVAASALAGAAPSMLLLVAARGFQGIGAGMLMATAFTSVSDLFPQPARRARWQGIITATFALASVIGPAVGGVMTDAFGWRSVFYVNLPLGALALLVLWRTLPANLTPRKSGARVDWPGIATIAGGIVCLLLAVEWGGREMPWSSPTILGLLAGAAVLFGLFALVERRAAEPLLPLDLLAQPTLALCAGIGMLVGFTMFGLVFYTPLFAQGALGMTPTDAGRVLTPLVLGMAAGSLTSGQTFARLQRPAPLMLTGATLLAVGAFLLTRLDGPIDPVVLGAEIGLCGLGMGMLNPMLTVLVQSSVPRHRLGVGTSTVQFLRQMGSTLGTAIVGVVVTGVFSSRLAAATPPTDDPRLVDALSDPQALVSPQALAQVQELARGITPDGPAQLQGLLDAGRGALTAGVEASYLLALGSAAVVFCLVLCLVRALGPLDDLRPGRDDARSPERGGAAA